MRVEVSLDGFVLRVRVLLAEGEEHRIHKELLGLYLYTHLSPLRFIYTSPGSGHVNDQSTTPPRPYSLITFQGEIHKIHRWGLPDLVGSGMRGCAARATALFPATVWAERARLNGRPFPATAAA